MLSHFIVFFIGLFIGACWGFLRSDALSEENANYFREEGRRLEREENP